VMAPVFDRATVLQPPPAPRPSGALFRTSDGKNKNKKWPAERHQGRPLGAVTQNRSDRRQPQRERQKKGVPTRDATSTPRDQVVAAAAAAAATTARVGVAPRTKRQIKRRFLHSGVVSESAIEIDSTAASLPLIENKWNESSSL